MSRKKTALPDDQAAEGSLNLSDLKMQSMPELLALALG